MIHPFFPGTLPCPPLPTPSKTAAPNHAPQLHHPACTPIDPIDQALYIAFSNNALQHKRLFTARGHVQGQLWKRVEVPFGWIFSALLSPSQCPPSLSPFYEQHPILCQNIYALVRRHAAQARSEVIAKTGLRKIITFRCHASMGIVLPQASEQNWHSDWSPPGTEQSSHWTLALPRTNHPQQGTTEFFTDDDQPPVP